MQVNIPSIVPPHSLFAHNDNLIVSGSYENIVLDAIDIMGVTNLAVEIINNSNSGNITSVNIYNGPNAINYTELYSNVFKTNIGPGILEHYEFSVVSRYLRITVETDSDIEISVYLHGNFA